jgi:dTMP kinase
MRGKFFVIEGPDGCGKTTLWEKLKDQLASDRFVFVRDPGSTAISLEIRKILLNPLFDEMCPTTELLLYMAARDQMLREVIVPALEQGSHVISDRYIQSTLAYQCDGNKTKGPFVSRELITALASQLKHPRPDVLFNMTKGLTVDKIRERLRQSKKPDDRLEKNDDAYFAAVLNVYQSLRFYTTCDYHNEIIDISALDDPSIIADSVLEMIKKRVMLQ